MESTALRQLLKSLSHNSQWEYAVFWKLKHGSRMLLTWEDGYCNYPKPRESVEGISDNVFFSEIVRITSSDCESSTFNGSFVGYPIGLAVATMSCHMYSLGEGVVGTVASTGKHLWFFADEFNSQLLPKYPDEWQLQFAVGVKTILLVPVGPHGVVQLGSLEMVTEDLTLVAHIKDMFNTLQHVPGASIPFISIMDLPGLAQSSPTSLFLESSVEPSFMTGNMLKKIHSELSVKTDSLALDGIQITNKLSTMNVGITSQYMDKDTLQVPGKNVGSMEGNVPDVSLRESALTHMSMNLCSSNDVMDQPSSGETGKQTDHKSVRSLLSFPLGSELHRALAPAFQKQSNGSLWHPTVSGENVRRSLSLTCGTEVIGGIEPSVGKSKGWFLKGDDAENLLDAMVADVYGASGDAAPNRSNSVRSPTTSLGQFAPSFQTQSQSESGFLEVLTSSSSERMTSELINEEHHNNRVGFIQSKKGSKLSHMGKRKARLGDIKRPRPRPRDRQMIQDRVKELRELIPNGKKCCIDTLLDRTIKHMLFLRSTSDQAEKLKHMHPKVVGRKSQKTSETQGHQNGMSWAFELGGQFGVCPIVIKDLDHPGHILIEMLCEEHQLFWEIAQVVRRLELIILKGVLEKHLDKMWAHFIVEASTGFQRMEIFWPLMQLLQRNSAIRSML